MNSFIQQVQDADLPIGAAPLSPADELLQIFDEELDTAAVADSRGQPIYRSVKRLSKMIGGEYGNRVIYELLQNAHDAQPDGRGQVSIHLIVNSSEDGELLIANGGAGFARKNLDAIRNIASSTKEIGEGIGNKGVGFRSVEALTKDPRIFSCEGNAKPMEKFDGYCFRLATQGEVEDRMKLLGKGKSAAAVAASMPQYLAAVPVESQPEHVKAFAREGYATVVSLPLSSKETINLAARQLKELVSPEAPVLLFLDRITRLEVRVTGLPELKPHLVLTRKAEPLALEQSSQVDSQFQVVTLGPDRMRWVMVRRTLGMAQVFEAVKRSISLESNLERWLNWQGDATVSCALPLDGDGLADGRLFNFLPMSADSLSPFRGHLDAPFYTSINRERARVDLPLNKYLLDVAAEVCAEAALALRAKTDFPPRCVVDFAAWAAIESTRLATAFQKRGVPILTAEVWPTTAGAWRRFGHVVSWPTGNFKVFTAARATKAGAAQIISNKLAPDRVAAVDALARRFQTSCTPRPETMASWAEIVAASLPASPKDDRWGKLYADLLHAFGSEGLGVLVGRKILLDRNSNLVAAGKDVYARHESGRRRKGDGPPLPPAALARKLTILADEITVRDTAVPFERAALWQPYDATEILERLPSLFTERQADGRREAALLWAFDVWRHDAAGAARVLRAADVHVLTRQGWRSAAAASFSQTWTETGADLNLYLAEAGAACPDSAAAATTLLVDISAWPGDAQGLKQDWIRFLIAAGVSDGLIPVPAKIPEGPLAGATWSYHFKSGRYPDLNRTWFSNAGFVEPHHPQTHYWRRGEGWKFPGQAIVEGLSDDARRRFAVLAVRHLQSQGKKYMTFSLLRQDRDQRHHDHLAYYTPLATFLASASWFPMESASALKFLPVAQGWLITERRSEPKFIPQGAEEIAALLSKDDAVINILESEPFRLNVWKTKTSAPQRLQALADACENVTQHERTLLRKLYEHAWKDLLDLNLDLVENAAFIVERPPGFTRLNARGEEATIYLRDSGSSDLARLLIDTGSPVLAVSLDSVSKSIQAKIDATGTLKALLVEDAGVGLLVDGEAFRPSSDSPPILNAAPWLAEALLLGHEFGADGFERNVNLSHVQERLRKLRLREAKSIVLTSQNGSVQAMDRYLHRDDSRPTLLVNGTFNSHQLVEAAKLISAYLHPNLHTFEMLLVRLVLILGHDQDLRTLMPSESQYAAAAQAPIEAVRDFLAAFRHDDASRVDVLIPLVAYFSNAVLAREIGVRLLGEGMSKWQAALAEAITAEVAEQLLAKTERTLDLFTLMKELGLEYARFNGCLLELGRPSLVSEPDLRRQFEVWKNDLRPQLLDRLRRHFQVRFDDPAAFAPYAGMRDLEFITYDLTWSESKQTIERGDVLGRANDALVGITMHKPDGKLPPIDPLRLANRKVIAHVSELAKRVLGAVGIQSLHEIWNGSPGDVAAALDRAGLLDFRLVDEAEALRLLVRSGFWPEGTPQSLDLCDHGLTEADMDRERQRTQQQQAEEKRQLNLVVFGDTEFDASDAEFSRRFAEAASQAIAAGGWEERSSRRLATLIAQPEKVVTVKGGGGRGIARPTPKLPETIRGAIGLAGELLAFRFLEAKHPKNFNDSCWVSENRKSLFPEDGDLTLGYDFRVATTDREWLYEVKATPGDLCEFELTDNEYRQAVSASPDRSRRYRILFVFHALDPSRCRIVELPNPVSNAGAPLFRIIGRSSTRMRFEIDQSGKRP
ncbi:sacsin N-terminal ATP-binding-like domain-containing protein [Variovorax sp. RB2P76]|uniref:sacsin N-terminal ATP-binding-like domain-containing protein n=1 Tax=Variovorax sp. RB2P76 TaxID=3443736 RepID=UPI003F4471F9